MDKVPTAQTYLSASQEFLGKEPYVSKKSSGLNPVFL